MYESFFRFSERPFDDVPDPHRIFWTDGHRRAFSLLQLGFERLSQVTVLTGGTGTGKTTLIRHLLQTTSVSFPVGLLPSVAGGGCDVLTRVLSAFGLDVSGSSEERRFRRLEMFLKAEGRRSVLVVDEAQHLSDLDLESLRLLSNMNADEVLMMLVLVGQPQLRANLTHVEDQRLHRRIGADYHLEPLSEQETADFVRYRCVEAGGSPTLFDVEALREVHDISRGVPRKINVLCDLALVSACAKGVRTIDSRLVRSVLEDARRDGAHISLTESDMADAADIGPATDAGESAAPIHDTLYERVERLALMRGSAGSGPDGKRPPPESGSANTPAAPLDLGRSRTSAPTEPAGLHALFGMAVPDDTLLFLDDPAAEDAAPSTPSRGGSSRGDRSAGAGHPAAHDAETGRSGPAPHWADNSNDASIRQAPAGAKLILHSDSGQIPVSAAASACPPSRGEVALRQAFKRQPGWRRIGWRGAGAAAFAASTSIATGIAIALLPDDTESMSEPAEKARRVSPEQVTEAPPLPITVLQTVAANSDPGSAQVVDLDRPDSAPAPSAVPVAEEPADAGDWSRVSPLALAYEDPDVDKRAAIATQAFPSPRRPPGGTGAQTLSDVWISVAQRSAAGRQPARLGQPLAPNSPEEPAEANLFTASPHDDAASPLNRHHPSAFAAPTPVRPAQPAATELHAARADSGDMARAEAAPGTVGSVPRETIAASGVQPAPVPAKVPAQAPGTMPPNEDEQAFAPIPAKSADADSVPQSIAETSPSAEADPEALFRDAVDIAIEDPRAAVIGYARAALLGHGRAAYYLGQIYETGDGVPVDFAIARHWYEAASDGSRRAENRLAGLPVPQGGGLTAPLPLLAQPLGEGHADFVWTSGEGADPSSYVVEISLDPKAGASATFEVTGSAARLPLVEGATHWRVLALDATGTRHAASDWRPVSHDGSDRSAAAETPPDHL